MQRSTLCLLGWLAANAVSAGEWQEYNGNYRLLVENERGTVAFICRIEYLPVNRELVLSSTSADENRERQLLAARSQRGRYDYNEWYANTTLSRLNTDCPGLRKQLSAVGIRINSQ